MTVDGILNLDKPRGSTSFRVVSLVRKWSRQRQVGHAGTLDPEATGVLPVCLGRATRLTEFLVEGTKLYRARIMLGASTDTFDASGTVTKTGDTAGIEAEDIEALLPEFTGLVTQLTPPYSAAKHQGTPLYRLAREGAVVPAKPRTVQVDRIALLDWRPSQFEIEVECGKGTYIRTLAHDMGERLGCGAHVVEMSRLRCGIFHLNQAVSLDQAQEAFRLGTYDGILHAMDAAVTHLPSVTVDETTERDIVNGRDVELQHTGPAGATTIRAYDNSGRFIALMARDDCGCWHPHKVLVSRS